MSDSLDASFMNPGTQIAACPCAQISSEESETLELIEATLQNRAWDYALQLLNWHIETYPDCDNAHYWFLHCHCIVMMRHRWNDREAVHARDRMTRCPNYTAGLRHDMRRDEIIASLGTRALYGYESTLNDIADLITEAYRADDQNRLAIANIVDARCLLCAGWANVALSAAQKGVELFRNIPNDQRNQGWYATALFWNICAIRLANPPYRSFTDLYALCREFRQIEPSHARQMTGLAIAVFGKPVYKAAVWYVTR